MERSFRAAATLVEALDREALAAGRPITRAVAAAILARQPGNRDGNREENREFAERQ
jgi:hypothetical protein